MFATRLVAGQIRPATLQPAFRRIARPSHSALTSQVGLGARRWNTQENKGGKAKLIFRFGLRDIPVELYPMAFVVAAACVGAAFAVGRHFYLDGLRLGPGKKQEQ